MAKADQRRTLVLREIAQCLTGLSEVKTAAEAADTLSAFLQGLPLVWHSVDLFASDRRVRRLSSWRCSRGFVPFVTRLGFLKRPDGVYHGTFADATLLLAKTSRVTGGTDCLLCGVGIEKSSPLNDEAMSACVGALICDGLSRVFSLETASRRLAVLESVLKRTEESVGLLDSNGLVIDRYPGTITFPPEVALAAKARRSRVPQAFTVMVNGRAFSAQSRMLTDPRPIEARHQLVTAKPAETQSPVFDRLKHYGLSERETQVAQLVFSGTTNRRIAETLFISADTVKTHCRRIFGKLGIERRTEFFRVMAAL